jgi:hypothetical protein
MHTSGWVLIVLIGLSFFLWPLVGEGRRGKPPMSEVEIEFSSTSIEESSSFKKPSQHKGYKRRRGDVEFSMSAIRDVYIVTIWKQFQDEHTQTLHIYSPDGNLFQKRTVPFSITTKLNHRRRKVSGITNPVDVQKTRPMKDGQAVVVQFPVSGTWVSQHAMIGTWRVDVFHNQESAPSVSGTFTLIE